MIGEPRGGPIDRDRGADESERLRGLRGLLQRDQGFAQNQNTGDNAAGRTARIVLPTDDPVPPSESARGYSRVISASGGLDIRV